MNQTINSSCETTGDSCGCATPAQELSAMTVSAFRAALAEAPDRPLTVLWPDGDPIEAHFHVTEVGRMQKDFVEVH